LSSASDGREELGCTGEHDIERTPASLGIIGHLVGLDDHDSVELESLGIEAVHHADATAVRADLLREPSRDVIAARRCGHHGDRPFDACGHLVDGRTYVVEYVTTVDDDVLGLSSGTADGVG